MLQCVAVCCSVLQRVAACCSVLQRVAISDVLSCAEQDERHQNERNQNERHLDGTHPCTLPNVSLNTQHARPSPRCAIQRNRCALYARIPEGLNAPYTPPNAPLNARHARPSPRLAFRRTLCALRCPFAMRISFASDKKFHEFTPPPPCTIRDSASVWC